jgi:hypothetical protein
LGRPLDELLESTRERIRAAGGLTSDHLRELGRYPAAEGAELAREVERRAARDRARRRATQGGEE